MIPEKFLEDFSKNISERANYFEISISKSKNVNQDTGKNKSNISKT
jgi:hypothetical protein